MKTAKVHRCDPLRDPRWQELVQRHPQASVFHTTGWLEALHRTYGYVPETYTTSPPDQELTNGIVLCRIRSWLTGNRFVSLPFSDHCQPLADNGGTLGVLIASLIESIHRERWKYLELRPFLLEEWTAPLSQELNYGESYCLHVLDLRPDVDVLFRNFHKSCVQRKIHRAEREHLTYEEGRSQALLGKFYHLLLITRRRHGLFPQPLLWFQNLIQSLGDKIVIRVVSKDGHPIASILTIVHKDTLVYKYGCSDSAFHNLGGVLGLHWEAIQDAKRLGLHQYDLGRSERQNRGLISFKENWGAKCLPLQYLRYPNRGGTHFGSKWGRRAVEVLFSRMPNSILTAAGEFLYRHIG